jgi:hypothetical protein
MMADSSHAWVAALWRAGEARCARSCGGSATGYASAVFNSRNHMGEASGAGGHPSATTPRGEPAEPLNDAFGVLVGTNIGRR